MGNSVPQVTQETLDGAVATYKKMSVPALLDEFVKEQPYIYNAMVNDFGDTEILTSIISSAFTTWYLIKRQMEINELNEANN
jgi:hypothetical protein